MAGRIVEIFESNRRLSLYRGFMEVQFEDSLVRIALDDLLAIVISGKGCVHTSNLLVALAERGIAFIICGTNYNPAAWILPVEGHHAQSARMQAQAASKISLKKRLWQNIIRAKISNQASVLDMFGGEGGGLRALRKQVKSGDPKNVEAQAARYYWRELFGNKFSRKQNGDGINLLLNYSYAIIRACVARGVMASGLHPTLGLHHRGPCNSMCLVDDLMEPFRPLADSVVKNLVDNGITELQPETKKSIAKLAVIDMPGPKGVTPLFSVATRLTGSLSMAFFSGDYNALELPEMPSLLVIQSVAVINNCD